MRSFVLLVGLALIVSAVGAKTLQSAYDQAGPGEGYDKLVVLDPLELYTGRCDLSEGKRSCIRGNGALVDLKFGQVVASGSGTELFLTGCCLVNGNAAVSVQNGAAGTIDGNTICKSVMGVKAWESKSCTLKNNIIYGNDYGVTREEYTSTDISYNDFDNNAKGNYVYWCPG